MITHRHHIIPKHAGGTDDPTNIVELTVEEHSEAHRILWETYHRIGDKVAWLMLAGKTTEAESALMELYREAGKMSKGRIISPETRAKIAAAKRGKPRPDLSKYNIQTKRGVPRGPQSAIHKQRKAEALKAYNQTPEGRLARRRASERMKLHNPNK